MTTQPKNLKLNSILIGTLAITFFVFIPIINIINIFCFAGVILGGFLGSAYYCSKAKQQITQIFLKDGILIGLFSGILSSVIVVLISLITTLLSKTNPMIEISEMFNSFFKTVPNEINEVIQQLSNEYETLGYSPTLMITMLVMNLIIYPVFGLIGGLIGVAIFRKSSKSNNNSLSV